MKEKDENNSSIGIDESIKKREIEAIRNIEVGDLFVKVSKLGKFEITAGFDLVELNIYKGFSVSWNDTHRKKVLKNDIEKYNIKEEEREDFTNRFNKSYYDNYWKPLEVRRWHGNKISIFISDMIWNYGLGIFKFSDKLYMTSNDNTLNLYKRVTEAYKKHLIKKIK